MATAVNYSINSTFIIFLVLKTWWITGSSKDRCPLKGMKLITRPAISLQFYWRSVLSYFPRQNIKYIIDSQQFSQETGASWARVRWSMFVYRMCTQCMQFLQQSHIWHFSIKTHPGAFLTKPCILRTGCWQSIPSLFCQVEFLTLDPPLCCSPDGLRVETWIPPFQDRKQTSKPLMFSSVFSLLLQKDKFLTVGCRQRAPRFKHTYRSNETLVI